MLPTSITGLLAVLAVCMPASQSAGSLPENTVVAQCSDDNHNKSNDRIYPGGWNFDIVGIQVSKPDYRPQRSKRAPSGFAFFNGWGFGFTHAPGTPQGLKVNMGRSFNFCIEDILAYRHRVWRKGSLSVGMGIDLKNYRMTGTKRFLCDPSTQMVSYGPYPEGSTPGTSKIRTLSTTYNLKYIQMLGRGFRLAVGPEISLVRKPGKKHEIYTTYTSEQGEEKERFRNIRTNRVGLNLVGIVSYRNKLGLYVKYSPTDVLDDGFGPSFQTLTTGIMIMGL